MLWISLWKELGHYRLPLSVPCEGKSLISCHHMNPKSVLQTQSSLLGFAVFCISQATTYGALKLALKIAITALALRIYGQQKVLFAHMCAELKVRAHEAINAKEKKIKI